jgi:hypothetical protein
MLITKHLQKHISNGNYYARIKINGKPICDGLKAICFMTRKFKETRAHFNSTVQQTP